MKNALTLTCLMAIVALGTPTLLAQDKPAAAAAAKDALPSGESILDKFVEATGGKEAYQKMKNCVQKGSTSVMGMSIEFTAYLAEPNLMLVEMEMPAGMGKVMQGFDGKTTWSYNPMMGPSVLTGKEADEMKNSFKFKENEWRSRYSKVETIGIETAEGEECYKVTVTTKGGSATAANFYSVKSGLLIKSVVKSATEMGEIEIQILAKDYRKVGDLILVPFQQITSMVGQTVVLTISEIKINTDIPPSTFEPPAEVKALIGK